MKSKKLGCAFVKDDSDEEFLLSRASSVGFISEGIVDMNLNILVTHWGNTDVLISH